jgi:heptosyltransferase-2
MIPNNETRQILIVQTAFLGDALLGLPLFKTLRGLFPSARLTLLCRRGVGSFFRDSRLIDETIEVDKSSRASWRAARMAVADREFDLLLCPHESFRTALFVSRVRARRKIGYSRFFNRFIFDDRVERPLELPEALRQLQLLAPLDERFARRNDEFRSAQSAPGGQGDRAALLPVPEGADMKVPALMEIRNAKHVGRRAAQATSEHEVKTAPVIEPFFDLHERLVVMAPGSVWATKMWTKEGFIEAGRALAKNAVVVVMGAREESELCAEIARAIPNATSLAGRTSLWESAQLLACADLLICNDSGAMHLGAAAGTPLVSVFGPTVLEFGYRPWASNAVVVQTNLSCRPCGKHGSNVCPIGTHDCMKKISAADVLAAAKSVDHSAV